MIYTNAVTCNYIANVKATNLIHATSIYTALIMEYIIVAWYHYWVCYIPLGLGSSQAWELLYRESRKCYSLYMHLKPL